jgi:hypothetical protein
VELLNKSLQHAPSLAIMAFMVYIFLKHLARRDVLMKTIGDECHTVQRDSIKAINSNTKMLAEVSVELRELAAMRREALQRTGHHTESA